jgi:hypothetical protein
VTPHVASKIRYSALDGRTTRHATYQVSQRLPKRVSEIFGGHRNSFQNELLQALLEVDCRARRASRISQPRTE